MSRMNLSLDSPVLPEGTTYDTQPIYEFDLEQCLEDGYTNSSNGFLNKIMVGSEDKISVCRLDISGAGLNRYFSTNMPHRPWDEGDVLQSRISPYVLQNDNYTPDPNYYNFETISTTDNPVATPPDDWGTASNYFTDQYNSISVSNVSYSYKRYINVRAKGNSVPTWAAGAHNYFKDTGRNAIKSYYTATDYSFGVYRCSSDSGSSGGPIMVGVGCDSSYISGAPTGGRGRGLMFTNPTGGMCQYHLDNNVNHDPAGYGGSSSLQSLAYNTYNENATKKLAYLQGTNPGEEASNCVLCFIHFTYNDPDPNHYQYDTNYYGVALITHNSLAENNVPTRIQMYGISGNFWGASIIGGGGGESIWGNDGPPAVPQGGNGTWSAPSNNHGDPDGTTAEQTGSIWGGNHSIFDIGYKKYILGSPDATAFGQMVGRLSNPEDWGTGFSNKYYNPIQAIISCHMIPANLAPVHTGTSKIVAATVNLTDVNVPTFSTLYYTKHIGSVNLTEYTGSFADYTNTSIYINLPYIGVKQLDTAACMNGQVAVDYLIDYLTGDTTAWVWVKDRFGNNNIRYEWKGNIARPIPLTQRVPVSTQIASAILPGVATIAGASVLGLGAGLIAGTQAVGALSAAGLGATGAAGMTGQELLHKAFTGSLGATFSNTFSSPAQSALLGMSTSAASAINAGQQMTSSNANGGSVSSPVNTQCYLSISRPQWSAPEEYRMHFGYPSDISGTISEKFHGFLSVRDIKLENIHATVEEKSEIISLMSAGVYVDDNFGPEE